MSGVGKTRSRRVLKKPKYVYKQNLVMNHHTCSKYKTKIKNGTEQREGEAAQDGPEPCKETQKRRKKQEENQTETQGKE